LELQTSCMCLAVIHTPIGVYQYSLGNEEAKSDPLLIIGSVCVSSILTQKYSPNIKDW